MLDKTTLFNFGCRMARYRIPEHEHRKCLVSFYSYARQIASIREKITLTFKKEEFDHEVNISNEMSVWIFILSVLRYQFNIWIICSRCRVFFFQIGSWIPPILPAVSIINYQISKHLFFEALVFKFKIHWSAITVQQIIEYWELKSI